MAETLVTCSVHQEAPLVMMATEVKADPVRTAVRFPLHLDITVSSAEGEFHAVTEDVSANGVLFAALEVPPVGARVEFRLTMPAAIMGGTDDVLLHCIGRIVRHKTSPEKKMAAAVIDEYSLKAEQP